MRRRRADRAGWERVLEQSFEVRQVDEPQFAGAVTLLRLHRLKGPFVRPWGEREYRLADDGFMWLQHFPCGARYTVTTLFDSAGEVIQWYIDICSETGVDDSGVPWFDDLYLDIAVLPTGEALLLDADELEEALTQGLVSQEEYELAWQEANRLLREVESGSMGLLALTPVHLGKYFSSSRLSPSPSMGEGVGG